MACTKTTTFTLDANIGEETKGSLLPARFELNFKWSEQKVFGAVNIVKSSSSELAQKKLCLCSCLHIFCFCMVYNIAPYKNAL